MVKLSKSINRMLSRINFDAFSQSNEWIGYFALHTNHKFDESYVHQAGLLVYDFFKKDWHNFFLLSALSYDDNIKGDCLAYDTYKDIYQLAKEKGLLQKYSEKYDKYMYGEISLPDEFLNVCFDKNFILKFTEMTMSLMFGKVIGQVCFLINPKLQIALYPHEDIGYGCINLGNDSKVLLDFLEYCNNHSEFISYINTKSKTR